jgi:hypothetical protein
MVLLDIGRSDQGFFKHRDGVGVGDGVDRWNILEKGGCHWAERKKGRRREE